MFTCALEGLVYRQSDGPYSKIPADCLLDWLAVKPGEWHSRGMKICFVSIFLGGLLFSLAMLGWATTQSSYAMNAAGDVESIHRLSTPTIQDALARRLAKAVRESGVLSSLPKGVTINFEITGEKEGTWYPFAMREVHGPSSGADSDVSPALAHFYVHESTGEIQWYDPVNDQRRSFADFVKSWKE